jgi:hypothetical protein
MSEEDPYTKERLIGHEFCVGLESAFAHRWAGAVRSFGPHLLRL